MTVPSVGGVIHCKCLNVRCSGVFISSWHILAQSKVKLSLAIQGIALPHYLLCLGWDPGSRSPAHNKQLYDGWMDRFLFWMSKRLWCCCGAQQLIVWKLWSQLWPQPVYACLCFCTCVCMSVFVCVCVCMSACACVFVHAWVCTSEHVCVSVCACVHICVCVSVCLCMHQCGCACACVFMSACVHICVCVCVCGRQRWAKLCPFVGSPSCCRGSLSQHSMLIKHTALRHTQTGVWNPHHRPPLARIPLAGTSLWLHLALLVKTSSRSETDASALTSILRHAWSRA